MATVRPTSYVLKLRHGEFDPLVHVAAVAPDLAADAASQIYIVQFVTQPLEEFRAAIAARGGKVYKFIANHAYLVKLTPDVRDAVAALPFVRRIGPYHPAYRLEDFLRDNRPHADQLFPSQRYNILTFERTDAQKKAVADHIEALGGTMNVRVRGEVIDLGFCVDHVDFASRPLILHTPVGTDSHGCQLSRPEAWAKNIIACGGVHSYDTLDPADDCWCSSASIGPAAEPRRASTPCSLTRRPVKCPGPAAI